MSEVRKWDWFISGVVLAISVISFCALIGVLQRSEDDKQARIVESCNNLKATAIAASQPVPKCAVLF